MTVRYDSSGHWLNEFEFRIKTVREKCGLLLVKEQYGNWYVVQLKEDKIVDLLRRSERMLWSSKNLIAESHKLERNAHERLHETKELLARTRPSQPRPDITSS